MIAVDSSVVIAACASWHESRAVALRAFEREPRLIGQFPQEPLVLTASELRGLVGDLHERGITGGAVYDGIVAMSARAHGADLISLGRRAAETYRRCEVAHRLL